MSLEGLQAILEKEEIVATQRALDLLERPEAVDQTYRRHVQTYVPLGRQAEDADNGQSVTGFERRLIREVRQAGAVRGYITAEYGHGKTSTALYVWDRARAENLLVVPPFQMNRLTDLLVASFGWVSYEVSRTRPGMLDDARELYDSIMMRSAKTLAQQYSIALSAAKRMAQDKPEILDITPADYIQFFEQMTSLAQRAGFDGLLVLADEVQQYIEPEIKAGVRDPISPLFDVISAILTRRNHLNFGLILILPPKELALMRDQRGDLVHRVLQISLDLGAVYDRQFAQRLWHRLAKEFDFEEHRDRIIAPECLESLGQISARTDLSDGPRTVVNAFRRATRRYMELGYPVDDPYSPPHIVEDLIAGRIEYDSPKKIPRVLSKALSHSLVKGHPERERAMKWAAAFPDEGIKRSLQRRIGLDSAFDDLAQSALGDLIISVGDIRDPGFTLRGLDQVVVESDWLTTTIREFWRTYYETADSTRMRAIKSFHELLSKRVLPDNQWTVVETIKEGLTRNEGTVFEGHFNSFSRKFPERRVHARILWEDEAVKDASAMGDVLIQIRLRRYLDIPEEKRRTCAESVIINHDTCSIDMTLNLMHRGESSISPNLERIIAPIVSPYKLTPLLLLTLYQVMEEKRENHLIPKKDDPQVQYFQSDLLDNVFRELFNPATGASVEAAQERIVEAALLNLLDGVYPDYDPLIRVSNWSSSLTKYTNALKHLETAHERQGQIIYEGTKDDVATLFTLSNTGLDTFISNFPSLIELVRNFPTRKEIEEGAKAAIRFRLHPLEQKIRSWLQVSSETDRVQAAGMSHEVHVLPSSEIYRRAAQLGYREKEIDSVLDLMVERGLVENDTRRGIWRETIAQAPSLDELSSEIEAWLDDIAELSTSFPDSAQLVQWEDDAQKAQQFMEQRLRQKPDDEQTIRLRRSVRNYRRQFEAFAHEKHLGLQAEAKKLLDRIPLVDPRQGEQLRTVVQGTGVDYISQVNDLRIRVLKQYTALEGEVKKARQETQATQAALKVVDLSPHALAQLAQNLRDQERQVTDLGKRCDGFGVRFNEFAGWRKLVDDGSESLDQIQMLGEVVQEQREQLHRLSQEINAHISAEKLGALPHAPTYAMRLAEIQSRVRKVRDEAIQRFNDLQDRYRQALVDKLGFPPDRLWHLEQYNPLAPDDSQSRLYTGVQLSLREMIDRLLQVVLKDQEDITATLLSQHTTSLPSDQRASMMQQGQELRRNCESVAQSLDLIQKELQDKQALRDFPESGEGQFHRILQQLSEEKKFVQASHTKVELLGRRLRELELTGPEQVVLKVLLSEDFSQEVSEIRQKAQSVDEDAFWRALQGLQAKRRLRVILETVKYD